VFCNSAVKAGGLTQPAHDGRLQRIEFQIAEAAGERRVARRVIASAVFCAPGRSSQSVMEMKPRPGFWPLVPPPPPPATTSTVSTLAFSWLRKYLDGRLRLLRALDGGAGGQLEAELAKP
jgi:hypothetical protein